MWRGRLEPRLAHAPLDDEADGCWAQPPRPDMPALEHPERQRPGLRSAQAQPPAVLQVERDGLDPGARQQRERRSIARAAGREADRLQTSRSCWRSRIARSRPAGSRLPRTPATSHAVQRVGVDLPEAPRRAQHATDGAQFAVDGLGCVGVGELRTQRLKVRVHLRPLVEEFLTFAEREYERVRYSVRQADALRAFLDDGRLRMDNNLSEGSCARSSGSALFAGSDDHAEAAEHILSLIASARLHELDPERYLRDVFRVLPHWPRERATRRCSYAGCTYRAASHTDLQAPIRRALRGRPGRRGHGRPAQVRLPNSVARSAHARRRPPNARTSSRSCGPSTSLRLWREYRHPGEREQH